MKIPVSDLRKIDLSTLISEINENKDEIINKLDEGDYQYLFQNLVTQKGSHNYLYNLALADNPEQFLDEDLDMIESIDSPLAQLIMKLASALKYYSMKMTIENHTIGFDGIKSLKLSKNLTGNDDYFYATFVLKTDDKTTLFEADTGDMVKILNTIAKLFLEVIKEGAEHFGEIEKQHFKYFYRLNEETIDVLKEISGVLLLAIKEDTKKEINTEFR